MDTPRDNWLAHQAAAAPDRLALRSGGVDLTYAELAAEVRGETRDLAANGIGRDSVVPLHLSPGPDFVIRLHALIELGAVAVPSPGGERPALHPMRGTPGRLPPADVVCRLFTSGTTGEPRAIDLTRGNFHASAFGSADALAITPSDRWLCCLPLFHVAGLSILTRSAVYGTGAVLHAGFDVDAVAHSLAEDRVTIVSLVVTQIARLLKAGVDLSSPRAIIAGGGPVPTELIDEALARGATIVQSYGMTETCSQVTLLEPDDARHKAGSAGRSLRGASLRTEEGEILVRGPMVAPGSVGEDGWLRTGDLGRIDEDGFLWVEGRLGDMIVTGGENVQPTEIEDVLIAHADVADAAVVGRPDPEWQEAVTAVVVMRPGTKADAAALRTHCVERLAGYKVPKRFEFAAELPRTASGKLLRRKLR